MRDAAEGIFFAAMKCAATTSKSAHAQSAKDSPPPIGWRRWRL
jgi:hypothetical protein